MSKDPAFLFYSSDFLTGTMIMSDAEVGQYIRLICFQHQHGHFDADVMRRLCGGIPTALLAAKFKTDDDGLFFNQRLEDEVIKRKTHSEKQKANANMRWHKTGIATAMPLEDENVNENKNVIEKEKRGAGKKTSHLDLIPDTWPADEFKILWDEFVEMRAKKKLPLTKEATKRRMAELTKIGTWLEVKASMLRTLDKTYDQFYEPKNINIATATRHGIGQPTLIRDKA